MDKYTYSLKVEKIQKLVRQEDYEAAAKIADTMDWEQEHNVRLLTAVAEAYEKNGQYTQAIDVLLTAYEHSAIGKRIMYQLTELALKAGRLNEAETFYKKYLEEAPDENNRYILRYQIAEAKGEDLDKRIAILETYKKYEFEEEWAYKLAELYKRAGREKECVALCDEIILWFGIGPYVDKAMELKENFEPLTVTQKEHRDNKEFYEAKVQAVADELEEVVSQKMPKKEVPEETAESVEEAEDAEDAEEELPVIGISKEVAEAPLDPAAPEAAKASFAGTLGAAVKKMADRAEAAVAAAEKAITSQDEEEEETAGGENEKEEKRAEAEAMEALGESVGKYMTEEPAEAAEEAAEAEAGKAAETAEDAVAAAATVAAGAVAAAVGTAGEVAGETASAAEEALGKVEETMSGAAEAVGDASEETASAAENVAEVAGDAETTVKEAKEMPKLDDVIFMEVVEAPEEDIVKTASAVKEANAQAGSGLKEVAGVTEEVEETLEEGETAVSEAAEVLKEVTEETAEAAAEAEEAVEETMEEAADTKVASAEELAAAAGELVIDKTKVRELVEKETPEQLGTTRNLKDILRSTLGMEKETEENLEPTKEIVLPPEFLAAEEAADETPVVVPKETPEEPGTMEDIQISMEEEPAAEAEKQAAAETATAAAPVTESAEALEKEAISAAAVAEEEPLDSPFDLDGPKTEAQAQIPLAADANVLPVISFEETERAVWEDQNRRLNEIEPLESHEMERCIFISTTSAEDGVNKAVEALEEYYRSRDMEVGPIAKIRGEKLNRRGLEKSLPQLTNKDLIIEEAGGLDDVIIREMLAVMEELDPDKVFVLTDSPENVDSLKQRFRGMLTSTDGRTAVKTTPSQAKKAAAARKEKAAEKQPAKKAEKPKKKAPRLNFERIQRSQELSERDFIRYADYFANELECVIDESGFDALEEEIAAIKKEGALLTAGEVEDIIEDAADHANRGTLKRLFSAKYDRDGYLILRNRDFQ